MAYLGSEKCSFKTLGEIREKMQRDICQGKPECGVQPGRMGRTEGDMWTELASES